MKRIGLSACAWILIAGSFATAQSRPQRGFIVDKTSTISPRDQRNINDLCQRVTQETSGEILVCVIRTTNGKNHRRFATNLFNRWGIGDRYDDNGILVFVAMQDRKAEIILGDGIDSAREEAQARTVMSDYMMPKFKQRKPSEGIRIAVEQCAERFYRVGSQPVARNTEAALDEPMRVVADPPVLRETPEDNANVMLAEVDPVGFEDPVAAALVDPIPVQPVQPVAVPAQKMGLRPQPAPGKAGFGSRIMGVLTGILGLGGAGFGIHHLATRRRRPRNCKQCGQPMMLLDEVADDQHLDSGERFEEQLGSVDYDVWVCTGCDHALKIRYGKFLSGYSRCSGCGSKTAKSKSRTVRHATTMMSGLREVETNCGHCGYHDVTQHVIPRKTESHSHSSHFGSGGGGSFGGGGGGFGGGGGSSSGGGASGGW